MSSPIVDRRVIGPGLGHVFPAGHRATVDLALEPPDTSSTPDERVPLDVVCPPRGDRCDVAAPGPPVPWPGPESADERWSD